MKMTDQKELPVTQEIAWQALNDIALLQLCIPGCDSIQVKDDGDYEVLINAAVGPVKAKFKGLMRMKDVVAPTSYTLDFSGQGGAVGYGRGEAQVVLAPMGTNMTLLSYSTTASVGGKLAQVGARLIDMAAQKMAADFFNAFLAELRRRHAPIESAAVEGVSADLASNGAVEDQNGSEGFWAGMLTWLASLFAKRKS